MQDLEKSDQVECLLYDIKSSVESYKNDIHRIYFDYDGVIDLLAEAQMLVTNSARCPRPEGLSPNLPWCERLSSGDDDFSPYVYDGTMSAEDYEKMLALMETCSTKR